MRRYYNFTEAKGQGARPLSVDKGSDLGPEHYAPLWGAGLGVYPGILGRLCA
jgi:hypothetical protein